MAADFGVTFQNALAVFDYAIRDKPAKVAEQFRVAGLMRRFSSTLASELLCCATRAYLTSDRSAI